MASYAAARGDCDMLKLLCAKGADLEVKNKVSTAIEIHRYSRLMVICRVVWTDSCRDCPGPGSYVGRRGATRVRRLLAQCCWRGGRGRDRALSGC